MTYRPLLVVIDDEPDMADLIASIGEMAGYRTECCLRAADFWNVGPPAQTHVVLDLGMPDMDGIAFLRELAAKGQAPNLILTSGHGERMLEVARRIATERGLTVLGTLPKPFRFDTLRSILLETWPDIRTPVEGRAEPWRPETTDLLRALAAGEIVPYFQPQVEMSSLRLVGAEALVRWPHPEHGMVTPDRLVPLVIEAGVENTLILHLVSQAMDLVDTMSAMGGSCRVSINASASALKEPSLADEILAVVGPNRNPSVLTLEVTETGAVAHLADALDILSRLRLRGVQLAIDDFGTGYSSLQQLAALPFTELKIDRSFVSHVDESDSRRRMLEGTASLGRRLDMTVVAEGVERDEEWAVCRDAGCDLVQGFLIGRPMPADEFLQWARRWTAPKSRCEQGEARA